MVRELFVRNGKYVNLWLEHEGKTQPSLLGMVDAKGFGDNSNTKSDSREAKRKALVQARKFEKEGWRLVSIRGIYSYGNANPYRYDIEAWGGFKR